MLTSLSPQYSNGHDLPMAGAKFKVAIWYRVDVMHSSPLAD